MQLLHTTKNNNASTVTQSFEYAEDVYVTGIGNIKMNHHDTIL